MNRAKKIACCGVFSALATVFLIIGAYANFSFTAGFLASICVVCTAITSKNSFWGAFICYVVSTVTASLIAPYYLQMTPFVFLFVPLALTKITVDNSTLPKTLGWIIKILCFEVFFVAYLLVYRFLFFENWQLLFSSSWIVVLLVILGQVAFIIYQIAFTHAFNWLKNLLNKIIK